MRSAWILVITLILVAGTGVPSASSKVDHDSPACSPRLGHNAPPGCAYIVHDGSVAVDSATITFTGRLTEAPKGLFDDNDTCQPEAGNCALGNLTLFVPDGFWDTHVGGLQVSMTWVPDDRPEDDRPGKTEYRCVDMRLNDEIHRCRTYGTIVHVPMAESGDYSYEFVAFWGTVDFTVEIQLDVQERPQEVVDLLPNLVMMPPQDLKVDLRAYGPPPMSREVPPEVKATMAAAGIHGCGPDETAESGARRCLRVSTGVANLGDGPMEVHMAKDQAAFLALNSAAFTQRIYRSDGSWYETAAAPDGVFHLTHAHLHYPRMVAMAVHAVLADGSRGAQVAESHKNGFCFANEGIWPIGFTGTWPLKDRGESCLVPLSDPGFEMGIEPNWFDMYETYRPGQYVEISGLPDGVYDLVATADPDDTIRETDEDDNASSARFRLTGNDVTLL